MRRQGYRTGELQYCAVYSPNTLGMALENVMLCECLSEAVGSLRHIMETANDFLVIMVLGELPFVRVAWAP